MMELRMNPLRALLRGGGKLEDRFTEALAELLKDQLLLSTFLRTLGIETCLDQEWEVLPWERLSSGGVPDLRIQGPGIQIFVEAKIEAEFGDNQIETYWQGLVQVREEDRRRVMLAILAPATKVSLLQQEAEKRTQTHEIKGISWEGVSRAIREGYCRSENKAQTDDRTQAFAGAFCDIVDEVFGYYPLELSEEAAMILHSREAVQALRTIDKLTKELPGRVALAMNGIVENWEDRGRFFRVHENRYWIGFWYEAWRDYEQGPLFLLYHTRQPTLSGDVLEEYKPIKSGAGLLVPLDLEAGKGFEAHLDILADRVMKLIQSEIDAKRQA